MISGIYEILPHKKAIKMESVSQSVLLPFLLHRLNTGNVFCSPSCRSAYKQSIYPHFVCIAFCHTFDMYSSLIPKIMRISLSVLFWALIGRYLESFFECLCFYDGQSFFNHDFMEIYVGFACYFMIV